MSRVSLLLSNSYCFKSTASSTTTCLYKLFQQQQHLLQTYSGLQVFRLQWEFQFPKNDDCFRWHHPDAEGPCFDPTLSLGWSSRTVKQVSKKLLSITLLLIVSPKCFFWLCYKTCMVYMKCGSEKYSVAIIIPEPGIIVFILCEDLTTVKTNCVAGREVFSNLTNLLGFLHGRPFGKVDCFRFLCCKLSSV